MCREMAHINDSDVRVGWAGIIHIMPLPCRLAERNKAAHPFAPECIVRFNDPPNYDPIHATVP